MPGGPHVLLCHSTEDHRFALQLGADLARDGCVVWAEEGEMRVGQPLAGRLAPWAGEADGVLVLLSEASLASYWLMVELMPLLSSAIDDERTWVFLVRLGSGGVPAFLRDRPEVRFADRDYQEAYEDLRALVLPLGPVPPEVQEQVAALSDPDGFVRQRAVEALRAIGTAAAASAIGGAARDPDELVRSAAVQALGDMGGVGSAEVLLRALQDVSARVRGLAAEALGATGNEMVVAGLTEVLHDPDQVVRWQAAQALSRLGAKAEPALRAAVTTPELAVRRAAVSALGWIGNPASAPLLADCLRDASAEVRQVAAFALGETGGEAAVPALAGALEDPSPEVRRMAALALADLRDEQALPALVGALGDSSSDVRSAAATGLGRIGGDQAIAALLKALQTDPDPVFQDHASRALFLLRTKET